MASKAEKGTDTKVVKATKTDTTNGSATVKRVVKAPQNADQASTSAGRRTPKASKTAAAVKSDVAHVSSLSAAAPKPGAKIAARSAPPPQVGLAQPLAALADFTVLAAIDVGNQAVLFAKCDVPADQIESIGLIEGALVPSYTALCRAREKEQFAVVRQSVASSPVKPVGTEFCALLSPLLVPEGKIRIAIAFADGSRAIAETALTSQSTHEWLNVVHALKSHLPALADLTNLLGASNSAVGRLYASLNQAFVQLGNPFVGAFDGIVEGWAEGWVYNVQKPLERVSVVLMEGRRPLAFGVADQFRADLQEAKKSDGRIKFSVQVPKRLCDGKPHTLSVVVEGTQYVLNKSPHVFKGSAVYVRYPREVIEYEISDRLIVAAASKLGESARQAGFERKLRRALMAIDNEEWRVADTLLSQLSQSLGAMPVIGLYQGVLEFQAGRPERAVKILTDVVRQAPEFVWGYVALGDACSADENFAGAGKAYESALRLAPKAKAIESRVRLAQLENVLHRLDQLTDATERASAIQICKWAVLNDPDNARYTDALYCLSHGVNQTPETLLPETESTLAITLQQLRHERLSLAVAIEALNTLVGRTVT